VKRTAIVFPSGEKRGVQRKPLTEVSFSCGASGDRNDVELELIAFVGVRQKGNLFAVGRPGDATFRVGGGICGGGDAFWYGGFFAAGNVDGRVTLGEPFLPTRVSTQATFLPSGEMAACSN